MKSRAIASNKGDKDNSQQSQHGSNSQQPVETVVNSPNVGTQYSFSFCIY